MKQIVLDDLWGTARLDTPDGLPGFALLIRTLRSLIEISQSSGISAFQLINSVHEPVELPCPRTGEPCAAVQTLAFVDRTVGVFFDAKPGFWLFMSNMSRGYPPSAIYFPDSDTLIKFDDPTWGVRLAHIDELKGRLQERENPEQPQIDARPEQNVLLTGDQNFAHVLWNQLPGFFAASETEEFAGARVCVTHEPLGPIEAMVPGLTSDRVTRLPPQLVGWANQSRAWLNNPGATRIPTQVMTRVLEVCGTLATPETCAMAEALDAHDVPVVWLSLRLHDRTAVNQQEFLEEVIVRLCEAQPDGLSIVLDGFSLPYDIKTNYDYSPTVVQFAERGRELAAQMIANLAERLPQTGRHPIHNACGLSIPDSLFLAQRASYYVAHHGTVQHKVGWIANCPGLVHSNRAIVAQKPEVWAASMIENGLPPDYIDECFIEDDAPVVAEDSMQQALNLDNYRFVRMDELVERVVAHFQEKMAKPQKERRRWLFR